MRPDGNTETSLRLIVSGGIGSGKTTVLRFFEGMGAVVIEADRIGHEILEPGGAAYDAVASEWPLAVVAGRIERPLLAAIVFNDVEELSRLESLTHPAIRDEIAVRVAAAGGRDVALELPLRSDLVGTGWVRIVVDAPPAVRLQRSIERGMPEQDASNRIAAQPERDEWLSDAVLVVDNTGSRDDLEAEAQRVWELLKNESRS